MTKVMPLRIFAVIKCVVKISHLPALVLRALGLLLADGAPTVGWGKTFWCVCRFFLTETTVTRPKKRPLLNFDHVSGHDREKLCKQKKYTFPK